MNNLPRFPAPFLEQLRNYVAWKNVLALSSVDRQEAPMRSWLINAFGTFIATRDNTNQIAGALARYKQCGLRVSVMRNQENKRYLGHVDPLLEGRVTELALYEGSSAENIYRMASLRELTAHARWPAGVPESVVHVAASCVPFDEIALPPRTARFHANSCIGSAAAMRWPATLTDLTISSGVDAETVLPENLVHLALGRAVKRIPSNLPKSLLKLIGGVDTRATDIATAPQLEWLTAGFLPRGLALPSVLVTLQVYNAPLDGIVWPGTLRRLEIGVVFDADGADWVLPQTLTTLHVWFGFPRPLHEVALPPGLADLRIGSLPRTRMAEVAWPGTLARLELWPTHERFRHCYRGVQWPPHLTRMVLGDDPYDAPLPAGLTHLTVKLTQSTVRLKWSAGLRQLHITDHKFGGSPFAPLRERIANLKCPKGLRCLTVGGRWYSPVSVDDRLMPDNLVRVPQWWEDEGFDTIWHRRQ